MLYKKSELKSGLFIKVITEKKYKSFEDMPDYLQSIWTKRYAPKFRSEFLSGASELYEIRESYLSHAKYQAEFSTITSAAIGVIEEQTKGKLTTTVIPIDAKTEKALLTDLVAAMDKFPGLILAGYNVTNYQVPLIVKRLLVNKVTIPFLLSIKGKKPWEANIMDVMRDYQGNMFGDVDIRLVADQFGLAISENPSAAEELQTTLQIVIAMSI